jgi:hypothetical protein
MLFWSNPEDPSQELSTGEILAYVTDADFTPQAKSVDF